MGVASAEYDANLKGSGLIMREADRILASFCKDGARKAMDLGMDMDLGNAISNYHDFSYCIEKGALSRYEGSGKTELSDPSRIKWGNYRRIILKNAAERLGNALGDTEAIDDYKRIEEEVKLIRDQAKCDLIEFCEEGIRKLIEYGQMNLQLGESYSHGFTMYNLRQGELVSSKYSHGSVPCEEVVLKDPSEIKWNTYEAMTLKEVADDIEAVLSIHEENK